MPEPFYLRNKLNSIRNLQLNEQEKKDLRIARLASASGAVLGGILGARFSLHAISSSTRACSLLAALGSAICGASIGLLASASIATERLRKTKGSPLAAQLQELESILHWIATTDNDEFYSKGTEQ